ncbi:serine hydrolase [Nonomuraea sp. bgisy101]|uniref:serine hydrolase n=1 Tax=Nonomuraea sp. bgisy101 TaxID=3413784 RepID=UPI003D7461FF
MPTRAASARSRSTLERAKPSAERIRAGLPRDWTIGDKTGGGAVPYAAASDIAIAWPPSGAPLIIAIYTHRNVVDAKHDDRVIASTASVLARGLGKIS